jgi:hypothetical protein
LRRQTRPILLKATAALDRDEITQVRRSTRSNAPSAASKSPLSS